MSTQCTAWAYRCKVGNPTAKAVLVYLADRASDDGTGAWPKISTICQVTKYKRRSVQLALKYLEEHGFIHPGDQRHSALASRGRTRPPQYRARFGIYVLKRIHRSLILWLARMRMR